MNTFFLFILSFTEYLINMISVLIMPAKYTNSVLLKIMTFQNNVFGVTSFVNDVIKKIESRGQNYIVNVVNWHKCGNSNILMRDVLITSI